MKRLSEKDMNYWTFAAVLLGSTSGQVCAQHDRVQPFKGKIQHARITWRYSKDHNRPLIRL